MSIKHIVCIYFFFLEGSKQSSSFLPVYLVNILLWNVLFHYFSTGKETVGVWWWMLFTADLIKKLFTCIIIQDYCKKFISDTKIWLYFEIACLDLINQTDFTLIQFHFQIFRRASIYFLSELQIPRLLLFPK